MLIVWPSLYEISQSYGVTIPIYHAYPYSPATSNIATYQILVDWDGDGDFSEATEDITSDVKKARFSRGRDSELGTASTGFCELRLNNPSGKYTPTMHIDISPKRLIQIKTTSGGSSVLFTGYLEDITPHPDMNQQDCYLTAVDGMDYLARCDIGGAYFSPSSKSVFESILDEANWPDYARNLDDGIYPVQSYVFSETSARDALEGLAESQGGWCYIDRNGYFVFEDANHQADHHATSEYLYNNNMASISYTLNTKDIFNLFKKEYQQITWTNIETIWIDPSVRVIPVEGLTLYLIWDQPHLTTGYIVHPFSCMADPGDYAYLDSRVETATGLTSMKVYIPNTKGSPITIWNCMASGFSFTSVREMLTSEDSASENSYQKRTHTVSGAYLSRTDTETLIDSLLAKSKDPKVALNMNIINASPELLSQILNLDIGSRVTVKNTKLGINADYYITWMEHEISEGRTIHTVNYRLSYYSLPTLDEYYFARFS